MKYSSLTILIRIFSPDALSVSSNVLKGISVGLNNGLKIFGKPCCKEVCCPPGFVVPFIEHRQSRFSIILKSFRICGIVNWHWLQLKSPAALAPNKRVSFSSEARH